MRNSVDTEIRSLGGDGILDPSDLQEFNEAEQRVLKLMLDYKWHTASEILDVAEQREGLRRMRRLRDRGYVIERSKVQPRSREWVYRLVVNP